MKHPRNAPALWKRWRRITAVVFAVALIAAACGDDDDGGEATTTAPPSPTTTAAPSGEDPLAALFPDGKVTIGFSSEAPYSFEDPSTGEPTGEAPEVAKAILAELGITEVEAVVVDFGSLIPSLQAGQYDMIAAGMFITPERAEQVLFSDPDYCAGQAFGVAAGNPVGLTDYVSLANSDATVGVLSGAVEEGYVESFGVPGDQVEVFGTADDAFDALEAGRIDAVALTDITVNGQVAARSGLEATPTFFPVIDGVEQLGCGGYGFLDQEFRDIFNAKLGEFHAEGKILPIVEPFGFTENMVAKAAETTVADLAG